ncbi:MAG: ABC transporter permease subunit [Anaerolineae bacterium]|nr:ABC transporter permease subunit [Anaerolineae bacterium]
MIATFRKAFWDSRMGVLWLAVGLALYAAMMMSFYPMLVAQAAELDDMIKKMPKQMIGMFYSGDLDEFSVSDPGVFLQGRYMLWAIIVLGVTVGNQAFNAFINAERTGTMDLMLSLPVSRRGYLLGRIGHTALTVLVVLVVSLIVFLGFTLVVDEWTLSVRQQAEAILAAFFPVMVIAGFAYMINALIPSSRHFGGGLVYVFVFGAYLVHSFCVTIEALEPIRPLFLYDYYDAGQITREGLNWGHVVLLSGVALVYLGVAYWRIDQKELGV